MPRTTKKHGNRNKKRKKPPVKEVYRDVFLTPRVFKNMVISAIEVYNRETNGALLGTKTIKTIGLKKKPVILITSMYPFQTDRRTPSQVVHGNLSAFGRVLRSWGSLETNVVGGFHSHPYPYYPIGLSEGDREHIKRELSLMKKHGTELAQEKWLEVLMSIRKRDYTTRQKNSWSIIDLPKKLQCIIKTDTYLGYSIMFSAYWVWFEKGKPKVREVGVFVPWLL